MRAGNKGGKHGVGKWKAEGGFRGLPGKKVLRSSPFFVPPGSCLEVTRSITRYRPSRERYAGLVCYKTPIRPQCCSFAVESERCAHRCNSAPDLISAFECTGDFSS